MADDSLSGRILDIGCQTGLTLRILDKRVRSYVGLDLDVEDLREAHRIFPAASLVRGDARNLPFQPGVFRTILAISVLEHVNQNWLPKVIVEFHDVLAHGGRLIIQIPNSHFAVEFHSGIPGFFRLPKRMREAVYLRLRNVEVDFLDLTLSKLLGLLQAFRLVRMRKYWYPASVIRLPHFLSRLRTVFPMGFVLIAEKA